MKLNDIKDKLIELVKHESVLIVEDDIELNEELTSILSLFFKEVVVAHDGEEGLNIFRENKDKFSIVVSDISMPKMNGLVMSEKMKEINENQNILILSAHSDLDYVVKMIDLGVNQFIIKPYEIDDLLNKIYKIIRVSKLEEENERKTKELIQSSRAKELGEMIGVIAHQWKQPLNAISTVATGAELEMSIGSEVNHLSNYKKIHENTKLLNNTLDEFRHFFNPNKERESIDVNEIIVKVLDLYAHNFSQNEIKIEKILCPKSYPISIFGNEMFQVIQNIIKNAIDSFEENNILNRLLKISTRIEGENFIVNIEDNAGGIPEDIIDKIFEPFFTTKTEDKGTGIGLDICKTIIETKHNGKLSVKNSTNGAVFTVSVPL